MRPPAIPCVKTSHAPGCSSGARSAGEVPGATSCSLTPMTSARRTRRPAAGALRSTRVPARSVRSRPCHPRATNPSDRDRVRPGVVELPRDGRQDPRRRDPPGERHGHVGQREPRLQARLDPTARRIDVAEDRAQRQPDAKQRDAGSREELELVRLVCLRVQADHRGRPNPQARAGQRRVRHAAAEPPAARIVGGDIAAPGAGDHDLGLVRTHVAGSGVVIRPAGHVGPVTWRRGSRGRRRPGRGTSCPRTAACRGGAPRPWSRAPRGPRTSRSRLG